MLLLETLHYPPQSYTADYKGKDRVVAEVVVEIYKGKGVGVAAPYT